MACACYSNEILYEIGSPLSDALGGLLTPKRGLFASYSPSHLSSRVLLVLDAPALSLPSPARPCTTRPPYRINMFATLFSATFVFLLSASGALADFSIASPTLTEVRNHLFFMLTTDGC